MAAFEIDGPNDLPCGRGELAGPAAVSGSARTAPTGSWARPVLRQVSARQQPVQSARLHVSRQPYGLGLCASITKGLEN